MQTHITLHFTLSAHPRKTVCFRPMFDMKMLWLPDTIMHSVCVFYWGFGYQRISAHYEMIYVDFQKLVDFNGVKSNNTVFVVKQVSNRWIVFSRLSELGSNFYPHAYIKGWLSKRAILLLRAARTYNTRRLLHGSWRPSNARISRLLSLDISPVTTWMTGAYYRFR